MITRGDFRLFTPVPDAARFATAGALLLSAAAHAGAILWAVSGEPVREMAMDAGGSVVIEIALIEGPEQAAAGDGATSAGQAQAGPEPQRETDVTVSTDHPGPAPIADPGTVPSTDPDTKPPADPEMPPAMDVTNAAPRAVDGAPIPPPNPRQSATVQSEMSNPGTAPSPKSVQVSLRPAATEAAHPASANPDFQSGGGLRHGIAGGTPGETTGAAPRADNPAPTYPAAARRRSQEGRVVLQVEVLPDGAAGAVRIERSSGVSSLDQAAFETVQRWRFRPAHRNGRPVMATVQVPVRFALK